MGFGPPFFGQGSGACLEYYAILYGLWIVTQMMLDAALFQSIINIPERSSVLIDLYQCILIPIHCIQTALQFFFMFDLYKAIIKISHRRARNWRTAFLCLLTIEISIFLAFIVLSSFFSVFTYVTAAAILFKVYLVWPLGLFLEESKDVSVPLAHGMEHHLEAMSSKPGPSGYSKGPSPKPGPSGYSNSR